MAGRRAGAGLALAAVTLSAAGCGLGGSTKTVTSTVTRTVTTTRTVTSSSGSAAACTGDQLSGTFDVVKGSQGAGHIAYLLALTNTSPTLCKLTEFLEMQLLSATGSPLPTNVVPSQAGGAGSEVIVESGSTAVAQARFSPDVPGTGDSQSSHCQPKAFTLRVTANGGGTVDAPITPTTSVCEQGTLAFDPLH